MTHSAQRPDRAARPQGLIIGVSGCGLSDARRRGHRTLNWRPTAPRTFAAKGADHAHCEPETRVRTLAGMAHALRVADRAAVRSPFGGGAVPALRSAGRGRHPRPRPDERVSPDALLARAAGAEHRAAAAAAAQTEGGVAEPLTARAGRNRAAPSAAAGRPIRPQVDPRPAAHHGADPEPTPRRPPPAAGGDPIQPAMPAGRSRSVSPRAAALSPRRGGSIFLLEVRP
jgi:hypothetical protein